MNHSPQEAAGRISGVLMNPGAGRLHFVEAAEAVLPLVDDLRLLIGVVPPRRGRRLVNFLGRFFGRPDVFERLQKRASRPLLEAGVLRGLPDAEALVQVLYRLADFGLVDRGRTQAQAWTYLGWRSRSHLRPGLRLLHVRSGAGRGGALAKARRLGIRSLCDQSIAHPAHMHRVIESLRGPYPQDEPEDFRTPFWDAVVADCREADLMVVNSDFVADSFAAEGFDRSRIRVLYWGVGDRYLGAKRDWARRGPLRLLFTGSCSLRKGLHHLMEALALLERGGVDCELHLAGPEYSVREIERIAGVGPRVVHHGLVSHERVAALLGEADLFVFPSLAEGCARSVMEAWGAGLPVVATRSSGAPLRHAEDGWIVPEGDPAALAAAVAALGADEALRRRLGLRGQERVRGEFTWARYADGLNTIYHEALTTV